MFVNWLASSCYAVAMTTLSAFVVAHTYVGSGGSAGGVGLGWAAQLPHNFVHSPHGQHHHHTQQLQQQQTNQQPTTANVKYKELIKVYESRNVEFGFPSEQERQRVLRNGQYIPELPLPIDVDVHYASNGKPVVFMTIPRFGNGVPYSLAYVTEVQRPNGTEVRAYPSYDWHSTHGADCNGLTSVYRIHIDSCGQMWILDSGEIGFVQYCAPQVVVIDLKQATLVNRYRLPENMYKTNVSRFVTPLVDVADPAPGGNCSQAFVYMADPLGMGIVVLDVVRRHSWRIENRFTYPDPDFATHTIAGESFQLLDGVFGFAVTPHGLGLRRMLYFHALSNDWQIAVPLDIINNSSRWLDGIASSLDDFVQLGRRGIQCAAPAMTQHGFLLCGLLDPIGIMGWNIRTPYEAPNLMLLAENPITLQFVSGLKVVRNPNTGRYDAWMLSNRLQKAFTNSTNFSEINYRIQRCGVDELILGTACKS